MRHRVSQDSPIIAVFAVPINDIRVAVNVQRQEVALNERSFAHNELARSIVPLLILIQPSKCSRSTDRNKKKKITFRCRRAGKDMRCNSGKSRRVTRRIVDSDLIETARCALTKYNCPGNNRDYNGAESGTRKPTFIGAEKRVQLASKLQPRRTIPRNIVYNSRAAAKRHTDCAHYSRNY